MVGTFGVNRAAIIILYAWPWPALFPTVTFVVWFSYVLCCGSLARRCARSWSEEEWPRSSGPPRWAETNYLWWCAFAGGDAFCWSCSGWVAWLQFHTVEQRQRFKMAPICYSKWQESGSTHCFKVCFSSWILWTNVLGIEMISVMVNWIYKSNSKALIAKFWQFPF